MNDNSNNQKALEFAKGKECTKAWLKPFLPYFLQKDVEDLQIHRFNEVTLLKTLFKAKKGTSC